MPLYDWIMLNIASPDVNGVDFRVLSDMTTENTLFMEPDYYMSKPKIRNNPLFQNGQGEFDQDKFLNFYYSTVPKWNDFANDAIVDNYEYNYYDTLRPRNALVRDEGLHFMGVSNPTKVRIGIEGFNTITDSGLSVRELALQSEIVDGATGKGTGITVNDLSLFGHFNNFMYSLFHDPLVYATYDEDTEEMDPYSGLMVLHFKGEYKLNADGNYYTETLAGRDLLGREVVSAFDYLTVDKSSLNKYDFFDADGLDKSLSGTIMRSIVTALPLFIPGVDTIYASVMLGKELIKIAPMITNVVAGLVGTDNWAGSHIERAALFLEPAAAKMQLLSMSSSDRDKMNVFTWNNIASMAGDLATIFASLAILVKGITRLSGNSDKIMQRAYNNALNEYRLSITEGRAASRTGAFSTNVARKAGGTTIGEVNARIINGTWTKTEYGQAAIAKFLPDAQKKLASILRWGQNASLVYFAMVLNESLYDELRLRGVDSREASLITLASMIGTFAVDKYAKLGIMFFLQPEMTAAANLIATRNASALSNRILNKEINSYTRKGMLSLILDGVKTGGSMVNELWYGLLTNSLSTFGKAIGEGLMRVSESVVQDLSKQLANWAGELGFFENTDYGAFENLGDRYGMAFLTGAIGGVVFDIAGKVKSAWSGKKDDNKLFDLVNDMSYLIRNGKKSDLLREYRRMYDSGILGSKSLSMRKMPGSDEANPVYMPALSEEDSLAYYLYQLLVEEANQIETILNVMDLAITDSDAFDRMVHRSKYDNNLKDIITNDKNRESAIFASYMTNWYDNVQSLIALISDKHLKLSTLMKNTSDAALSSSKEFKDQREALLKDIEDLTNLLKYLFGKGSLGYIEEMLWAMTSDEAPKTLSQFIREQYGKSIDEVSDSELSLYTLLFLASLGNIKRSLHESFLDFKRAGKTIMPKIKNINDIVKDTARQKRVDELLNSFRWMYEDDLFEDELKDPQALKAFEFRNEQMEGETPDEFAERHAARIERINKHNEELVKKFISELSKLKLSLPEQRRALTRIGYTSRTWANKLLEYAINEDKGIDKNLKGFVYEIFKDHLFGTPLALDKVDAVIDVVAKDVHEKLIAERGILSNARKTWAGAIMSYFGINTDNRTFTKRDAYNMFLKSIKGKRFSLNGADTEEAKELNRKEVQDVMKTFASEDADFTMPFDDTIVDKNALNYAYAKKNSEIRDFIINAELLRKRSRNLRLKKGDRDEASRLLDALLKDAESEIVYLSDETFAEEVRSKATEKVNNILNVVQLEEDKIPNNTIYKLLSTIGGELFARSPILDLLRELLPTVVGIDKSLDDFLASIFNDWMNRINKETFTLTKELQDALEIYYDALLSLKAFVNATREPSKNGSDGISYNYALNDFILNHRQDFPDEELRPTIKNDVWGYVMHDILLYMNEINQWRSFAKTKRYFIEESMRLTDAAVYKTRKTFWDTNRDSFKLKVKDAKGKNITVDLLEGVDSLTFDDNPTFKLISDLEDLIRKNFIKAYENDNLALTKLLTILIGDEKSTDIKESRAIVAGGKESIRLQRVLIMDVNYNYDKLTDYDKISYVMTVLASDVNDFVENILNFMNKTGDQYVPLSVQQTDARMIHAMMTNPELIDEYCRFVVYDGKTQKMPYAPYTVIVDAGSGTGKTEVVSSINIKGDTKIWACGPLVDHTNKIADAVRRLVNDENNIVKKTRELLLNEIAPGIANELLTIEDEYDVKGKKNGLKKNAIANKCSSVKTFDDNESAMITSELVNGATRKIKAVSNTDDLPDVIIIDEGTWFTSIDYQLIGEYVKLASEKLKKPIALVVLGDGYQNGISAGNLVHNMNREHIFAFRTMRMVDSFRADNNLKLDNITKMRKLLDFIDSLRTKAEADDNFDKIINDLKALNISYYYRDGKLAGDIIVNALTNDMVNCMTATSDKKIGYIGPSTDTASYTMLKNKFGESLIDDKTAKNVLGLEYDYVVVDKDWAVDKINVSLLHVYNFLTDLYTMTTRARKACVLIDSKLLLVSALGELGPSATTTGEVVDRQIAALRLSQEFRKLYSDFSNKEQIEKLQTELMLSAPVLPVATSSEEPKELENAKQMFDNKTPPNDEMTQEEIDEASDNNTTENTTDPTGVPSGITDELVPKLAFTVNMKAVQEPFIDWDVMGLDLDYGMRIYTNLQYYGVRVLNGKWVKLRENAKDPTLARTDLNIFMEKETLGNSDEDLALKKKHIKALVGLRCAMIYRTTENVEYYHKLDNDVTDLFTKDDLLNATYIIRSRKVNNTNNILERPDLDDELRAIGNDRMVTLVARILANANGSGEYYYVTMGAFALPSNWLANRADIEQALRKVIDNPKTAPEVRKSKEAYLNALSSGELTRRYDEFIKSVSAYDIDIVLLDLPPLMSNLTTLIKKHDSPVRLAEINSNGTPYDDLTPYTVRSHVFVIDHPEDWGLSTELVGRELPAMLVSSNTLLEGADLVSLYQAQREAMQLGGPEVVQLVRLIILDKIGIPFKALFDSRTRDKFLIENGMSYYSEHNPILLLTEGARVYMSLWNFRAGLIRFRNALGTWMQNNNFDMDAVHALCNLENTKYNEARLALRERTKNPKEVLSEAEFRKYVLDKDYYKEQTDRQKALTTEKEKKALQALWDLNNKKLRTTKFFRLGSPENYNGFYIRSVMNADRNLYADHFERVALRRKNNEPYDRIKDNVYAAYIDPDVADTYFNVMDAMFKNIFDKIILPPKGLAEDAYLTNFDAKDETEIINGKEVAKTRKGLIKPVKKWYLLMNGKKKMSFEYVNYLQGEGDEILPAKDEGKAKVSVSEIESMNLGFALLMNAVIILGKNFDARSRNFKKMSKIKCWHESNSTDYEVLNLDEIFKALGDPIRMELDGDDLPYDIKGVVPYAYEEVKVNGKTLRKPIGQWDRRMDHMFNLMFHGLTTPAVSNEFGHGEELATDAKFKYGFFTDVIYLHSDKRGDYPGFGTADNPVETIIPVASNECFFIADAIPAMPTWDISTLVMDRWLQFISSNNLRQNKVNTITMIDKTARNGFIEREILESTTRVEKEKGDAKKLNISQFVVDINNELKIFGLEVNPMSTVGKTNEEVLLEAKMLIMSNLYSIIKTASYDANIIHIPVDINYTDGAFSISTLSNFPLFASGIKLITGHTDNTGFYVTLNDKRGTTYNVTIKKAGPKITKMTPKLWSDALNKNLLKVFVFTSDLLAAEEEVTYNIDDIRPDMLTVLDEFNTDDGLTDALIKSGNAIINKVTAKNITKIDYNRIVSLVMDALGDIDEMLSSEIKNEFYSKINTEGTDSDAGC